MKELPMLIGLDLDDTLLDRESRLPTEEAEALRRAMERGAEVVIATGRAYATIPREMLEFPGIRYAISGNGAVICNCKTGEVLLRKTLTPRLVRGVLEKTREEDAAYEAFLRGEAYAQADYLKVLHTYMMDQKKQEYVLATRIPVPDILEFIREHAHELDSLAVIPRNMEVKRRVTEALGTLDGVYITTSAPRLVEVNCADCTKQAGLRFLAELLNIPQAQTAAFGNADNDAEMLNWAGVGVAVGNATPKCMAAADYVTDDFERHGVSKAFQALWGV